MVNEVADHLHVDYQSENEPDLLYYRLAGESEPWPVFVFLDIWTGRLVIDNVPPGSTSFDEAVRNSVLKWQVPTVPTTKAANRILDAVAPLARRILADSTLQNENGRWSRSLGPKAKKAEGEIERTVEHLANLDERVEEQDAATYFEGVDRRDLPITADTTDEEIEKLASEYYEDLKYNALVGCILVFGIKDYLTGLRNELREARSLQEESNGTV